MNSMPGRSRPFYSERERAALEWTEVVTRITEGHVADDVYERVRGHFTAQDLVHLTLAIATINSWNRLAIAFRSVPGAHQPPKKAA